jgi:hypothetical protein
LSNFHVFHPSTVVLLPSLAVGLVRVLLVLLVLLVLPVSLVLLVLLVVVVEAVAVEGVAEAVLAMSAALPSLCQYLGAHRLASVGSPVSCCPTFNAACFRVNHRHPSWHQYALSVSA